jgi:hypothetical protein
MFLPPIAVLPVARYQPTPSSSLSPSPIPLYTTFDEVRLVAKYLDEALEDEAKGSASSGREEENKGAGATQTS